MSRSRFASVKNGLDVTSDRERRACSTATRPATPALPSRPCPARTGSRARDVAASRRAGRRRCVRVRAGPPGPPRRSHGDPTNRAAGRCTRGRACAIGLRRCPMSSSWSNSAVSPHSVGYRHTQGSAPRLCGRQRARPASARSVGVRVRRPTRLSAMTSSVLVARRRSRGPLRGDVESGGPAMRTAMNWSQHGHIPTAASAHEPASRLPHASRACSLPAALENPRHLKRRSSAATRSSSA